MKVFIAYKDLIALADLKLFTAMLVQGSQN